MNEAPINLEQICADLRQINIRRNIAQRTRKALEQTIRARICQIFLDDHRQKLRAKGKLNSKEIEAKVLEISKDAKFKASIQKMKEAIIKPLGEGENGLQKKTKDRLAKVWMKYPEVKKAIDLSTHGVQVGLRALITDEKSATKHLNEVAETLPVWQQFAKNIYGLGLTNVGKLIGEAGVLSRFHSKEALYKYLGLGVFNGHAQGKIRGLKLKGDAAIPEGYNRGRLSSTLLIGQNILKSKGTPAGLENPYVKLLLIKWKDYEEKAKVENALIKKNNQKMKKDDLKKLQISKKTVMLRSIRWITKMIVRDLQRAWNACEGKGEMPKPELSPMLLGIELPKKKKGKAA